jgi:hypothetical protein
VWERYLLVFAALFDSVPSFSPSPVTEKNITISCRGKTKAKEQNSMELTERRNIQQEL